MQRSCRRSAVRAALALAWCITQALRVAAAPVAGPAAATAAPASASERAQLGETRTAYASVVSGQPLRFPQDLGSHPAFRTEWWYVTGWLNTESGALLGFQITFFRTRPDVNQANPSSFNPRQLLVAHCAISDPQRGRLWQDQRIRRAGLGFADASAEDTDVHIERWSLRRERTEHGAYTASIDAEDFAMHLQLSETQAPLINGDGGVSRKGPEALAASYYYSLPHIQVVGTIERAGALSAVSGEAWFDHEWSSEYLDSAAVGWDWIGINLVDGGALMAFRIRSGTDATRWAGGTYRSGAGETHTLTAAEVQFSSVRRWTSPRTGITYPTEWRVFAGGHDYLLEPLMDDQENDTRLSTGAIYWEGAVRASEAGKQVGRGYLELTGYGERLRLR